MKNSFDSIRRGVSSPEDALAAAGVVWDIFEQSPFSSVIYDAEGHPLSLNRAFREMWGVGLDTMPAGYSVLADPELERQGVLPFVQRAFQGEVVSTPPVRYDIAQISVSGSGRSLWSQGHFFPIRDAQGRLAFVVLTHIDLTERTAVEEALRASEGRFSAIVEQATVGIAQVDLQGRFVLVNDRYCDMLGRTRDELLQLTVRDVTHPEDWALNQVLFGRALETGEPFSVEKRYVRADGSFLWVNNSVSTIRSESGEVETVLAVSLDITDRRRAESALRLLADAGLVLSTSSDHETTLRGLAELAVPTLARWCMVFVRGAQEPLRLVATACAAEAKRELVERLAVRVTSLPGIEHHPVRRVLETGEPRLVPEVDDAFLDAVSRDPEYRHLAGALAPHSLMVVPLLARGSTRGVLLFATDDPGVRYGPEDLALAQELARRAAVSIDNARLLHEAEEARADAEEANRAKSEFLAVMSHELRTPLNAIAGYVDLLDLGVYGPVTAQQREAIGRISRSQRHLLSLINEVLHFARIEGGRLELRICSVALEEVHAALEQLVRPQLQSRGLVFEWLPCGPELAVRADQEKLLQILLNLVSNAIKFTPPDGRIRVHCEPAGEQVKLVVTDTGVGIAPDQLRRIFDPFVQLERRLNNPVDGAGLGLAISRNLAQAMDGELSAVSTPGEGSSFILSLPRG